jgi:hypothetical protein
MKDQKIARGPLLIVAGLTALAALCAGVLYGKFDYSELCAVCGRARDVVDWQVPGTQRNYYTLREERPTALSGVLEQRELVAAHDHQWQFVRGHGNGRTIVLGAGHPISWSLLSPHMGTFMESMLEFTDRETALRWLNQLRDPTYSRLCQAMADAASRRSFQTRAEWEDWLRDFEAEHALLVSQAGP